MSYRISDEKYAMDTVEVYIRKQKEFVFHIDEEPDICRNIKIGDTVFENDTYICTAMSSVDEDGYVKVVLNFICPHCDGYGGEGDGYVPEQKGMLPSMCGYCDGKGVDK